MEPETFTYEPMCSAPGCERPAVFKIAAVWSDGTTRELKPYGMSCEAHRDLVLASARERQKGLRLIETESIEPVGVYQLLPGVRDSELTRL
ncbi:MAG TPA: hypothetical protein VFT74_01155 [Isosphaeraceae bacterium]|nr:hypothetical protein [Isosphaeraceae bacterium]